MAIAVGGGLPLGVLLTRRAALRTPLLGFANMMQTIPSLALFGFLIPIPFIGGIGKRTAIVALVLYALLPILRNTLAGILGVDAAVRESAIAMGMTGRQLLWEVELPLAAPTIIAGVRIATVTTIGTATIAAAIGAGGLGVFIFRGIASVDTTQILAGAIPAALLALLSDGGFSWIERRLLCCLTALILASHRLRRAHHIVVGSKNFTEQLILGEIIAQHIEARTASTGGAQARSRRNAAGPSGAAGGGYRHVSGIHRHRVHQCAEAQRRHRSGRGSGAGARRIFDRLPSGLAGSAGLREFVRDDHPWRRCPRAAPRNLERRSGRSDGIHARRRLRIPDAPGRVWRIESSLFHQMERALPRAWIWVCSIRRWNKNKSAWPPPTPPTGF